jgi:aminoglycoside phosphotransferase (APT) family kinase protein
LEHVWPTSVTEGLRALIEAMPSCRRMLHGDFHVKNIMVQKGEALLIDMDTLCVGDPVFEFAGMYKPYISYPEIDPGNLERFFGISDEVGRELWEGTARHYFGELSDERWAQLVDRSRLLASLSTGASFAKKDLGKPRNREALDHFQAVVEELLPRVDHLALLD